MGDVRQLNITFWEGSNLFALTLKLLRSIFETNCSSLTKATFMAGHGETQTSIQTHSLQPMPYFVNIH